MPHKVRTHTRRTAAGRTTTVHQHQRTGGSGQQPPKRKRGPNPGHAGKLGKRALRHGRKGRKGKAAMFAVLALGEVLAWFTLSGTSFILALTAGVLMGLSVLLVK